MPILITGLLALAQVVYLPGAIVRRAFALEDDDTIERAILTFALSLVANTVLVAALVAVHAYTRPVLIATMLAEAVFIAIASPGASRARASGASTSGWRDLWSPRRFGGVCALLLTIATVVILIRLFGENWGTVFTGNDDVANWDRWARDWAHGIWPQRTGWYPQLLPSNWSITYVLLGRTDIKMFAKATTVLFAGGIIGLFVTAARRRADTAFLWGAALCGWLLLHYLGPAFLQVGYADVPFAFFGLLTWNAADRSQRAGASAIALALSLTAAVGAVLAKQGGVYVLVVAGAYAGWCLSRRATDGGVQIRRAAVVVAGCALAFASAWYAGKAWQIWTGADETNLMRLGVTALHGRTYPERLRFAAHLLWTTRGADMWPVPTLFLVLLAGSIAIRRTRWITLLVIAPFLFCWALFFGYEVRNAALASPLIALVCGVVVDRVLNVWTAPLDRTTWRHTTAGAVLAATMLFVLSVGVATYGVTAAVWMPGWLARLCANAWMQAAAALYALPLAIASASLLPWLVLSFKPLRVRVPALVLVVLAIVAAVALSRTRYTDAAIVADQHARARQIGVPSLDDRLYATFSGARPRGLVSTDYMFLRELPDLGALYLRDRCVAPCTIAQLTAEAKNQPEVGYFLLDDGVFDAATHATLESSKAFLTVFLDAGFRLLAVDRSAMDLDPRAPALSEPATATARPSR